MDFLKGVSSDNTVLKLTEPLMKKCNVKLRTFLQFIIILLFRHVSVAIEERKFFTKTNFSGLYKLLHHFFPKKIVTEYKIEEVYFGEYRGRMLSPSYIIIGLINRLLKLKVETCEYNGGSFNTSEMQNHFSKFPLSLPLIPEFINMKEYSVRTVLREHTIDNGVIKVYTIFMIYNSVNKVDFENQMICEAKDMLNTHPSIQFNRLLSVTDVVEHFDKPCKINWKETGLHEPEYPLIEKNRTYKRYEKIYDNLVQKVTDYCDKKKNPNYKHLYSLNLLIVGDPGSGKSQLSRNIVELVERSTGIPHMTIVFSLKDLSKRKHQEEVLSGVIEGKDYEHCIKIIDNFRLEDLPKEVVKETKKDDKDDKDKTKIEMNNADVVFLLQKIDSPFHTSNGSFFIINCTSKEYEKMKCNVELLRRFSVIEL